MPGKCGLTQEKLDEKKWVAADQTCDALVEIGENKVRCGDLYSKHGSVPSSSATELPIDFFRRHCESAGIHVEERVINMIQLNPDLSSRVTSLGRSSSASVFVQLYRDAASRLGSSTKRAVSAVDSQRNIVINGVFLAHSSSSDFYYAYEDGVPCLLKMPKKAEEVTALKNEAAAYERVKKFVEDNKAYAGLADAFRFLVPVELIELVDPRTQQPQVSFSSAAAAAARSPPPPTAARRIIALKMPVYIGTLQECPSDVRLAQLYANAADAVGAAMTVLHHSGLVHCDVKPSNIFIDSRGQCLLGDYDAVVSIGQPVNRCTSAFLPEPFYSQFNPAQPSSGARIPSSLVATPALDYAMLSFTLLAGMEVKLSPRLSLEEYIQVQTARLQQSKPANKVEASIYSSQEKILHQLTICAEMKSKQK